MTEKEIYRRIKEITEKANHYEAAHVLEDALMIDFIKFIASERKQFSKLAKLILRTELIDFPRWYSKDEKWMMKSG